MNSYKYNYMHYNYCGSSGASNETYAHCKQLNCTVEKPVAIASYLCSIQHPDM